MQTLRRRLVKLGYHSLKEWFEKNPEYQFKLMLSNNNAACFRPLEDGKIRLEMAPAYLDERGVPQRETIIDSKGVRWESVLVFYEKETHRKYSLKGTVLLTPEDMEEAFSQAESAYEKETSKVFRPSFLFDFIEYKLYKINEKGEKK